MTDKTTICQRCKQQVPVRADMTLVPHYKPKRTRQGKMINNEKCAGSDRRVGDIR